MELFKWNLSYSVNSSVLDDQHKRLFDIVNELYAAFANREHKEKLSDIIRKLHEYTIYHFTEEEKLLQKMNKPLPLEHLEAHQDFINKITDFKKKSEKGSGGVTYEMMSFLRNWLIEHIQGTDKKYSAAFDKSLHH